MIAGNETTLYNTSLITHDCSSFNFKAIIEGEPVAESATVDQQVSYLEFQNVLCQAPLFHAISCGLNSIVRTLLADGANLNTIGGYGDTPLLRATREGELEIVQTLLKAGAEINGTTRNGSTPLHLASEAGDLAMMKFLLAAGADKSAFDDEGDTPLHTAIRKRHLMVAQAFLTAGADANALTRCGYTALHIAAAQNDRTAVELLLKTGADINILSDSLGTPLHIASEQGHVVVMKELLKAGADVNMRRSDNWTPLHIAVDIGSLAGVITLLAAGADHNATRNDDACTPLLMSSSCKSLLRRLYRPFSIFGHRTVPDYFRIVRILLAAGADANPSTKSGSSPLLAAIEACNIQIVDTLLDAGAIPDRGALHKLLFLACQKGYMRGVNIALKIGVGINVIKEETSGNTPLILAAKYQHRDIVAALLSAGADPNCRNFSGETPLTALLENFHLDESIGNLLIGARESLLDLDEALTAPPNGSILPLPSIQWLLAKGANPNAINREGNSLLLLAISAKKGTVVSMLLQTPQVNLNARNHARETPLLVAMRQRDHDLATKLVNAGATIDEQHIRELSLLTGCDRDIISELILAKQPELRSLYQEVITPKQSSPLRSFYLFTEDPYSTTNALDLSPRQTPVDQSQSSVLHRDWCMEYLDLILAYRARNNDDPQLRLKHLKQLKNLANDFVTTSTTLAKIILDEIHLPDHLRTIGSLVRGMAGGIKFQQGNIILKLAEDKLNAERWIYGGNQPDHHLASKSATAELRGIAALNNIIDVLGSTDMFREAPPIILPFICVISFRGYKLSAMSKMPISGSSSLISGSADAGNSFPQRNDAVFDHLWQTICHRLHIDRRHRINGHAPICGPFDLEAHKVYHPSSSQPFYVLLDTHRLFPSENTKHVLSSFFRPELLQQLSLDQQFSPDTFFSQCSDPGDAEMQLAHRDLQTKLLNKIIPTFANELMCSDAIVKRLLERRYRITSNLHRAGINLRFLPRLIQCFEGKGSIQVRFIEELLARALKNTLNVGLREKDTSTKTLYKYIAWFFTHTVKFLLNDQASQDFLNSLDKQLSYFTWPKNANSSTSSHLFRLVDSEFILERLQTLCHVKVDIFSEPWFKELAQFNQSSGKVKPPPVEILPSNILEISPSVKHLPLVDTSSARYLLSRASKLLQNQSKPIIAPQIFGLLNQANHRFNLATQVASLNDPSNIILWAVSQLLQAQVSSDLPTVEKLTTSAIKKLKGFTPLSPLDELAKKSLIYHFEGRRHLMVMHLKEGLNVTQNILDKAAHCFNAIDFNQFDMSPQWLYGKSASVTWIQDIMLGGFPLWSLLLALSNANHIQPQSLPNFLCASLRELNMIHLPHSAAPSADIFSRAIQLLFDHVVPQNVISIDISSSSNVDDHVFRQLFASINPTPLTSLQSINLSHTRIGTESARILFDYLSHVQSTQSISLSLDGCDQIDDSAFDSLQPMNALQTLSLQQLAITNASILSLIRVTRFLMELKLDGCSQLTTQFLIQLITKNEDSELICPKRISIRGIQSKIDDIFQFKKSFRRVYLDYDPHTITPLYSFSAPKQLLSRAISTPSAALTESPVPKSHQQTHSRRNLSLLPSSSSMPSVSESVSNIPTTIEDLLQHWLKLSANPDNSKQRLKQDMQNRGIRLENADLSQHFDDLTKFRKFLVQFSITRDAIQNHLDFLFESFSAAGLIMTRHVIKILNIFAKFHQPHSDHTLIIDRFVKPSTNRFPDGSWSRAEFKRTISACSQAILPPPQISRPDHSYAILSPNYDQYPFSHKFQF